MCRQCTACIRLRITHTHDTDISWSRPLPRSALDSSLWFSRRASCEPLRADRPTNRLTDRHVQSSRLIVVLTSLPPPWHFGICRPSTIELPAQVNRASRQRLRTVRIKYIQHPVLSNRRRTEFCALWVFTNPFIMNPIQYSTVLY